MHAIVLKVLKVWKKYCKSPLEQNRREGRQRKGEETVNAERWTERKKEEEEEEGKELGEELKSKSKEIGLGTDREKKPIS